jgi:glyoxylase I family protein
VPSMIGYHHLSLSVRELARSVEWYRKVLGLAITGEVEGPGFRRARLRHDEVGLTLTLTCHEGGHREPFSEVRAGMDHVAFQVPSAGDLRAWKQRFEELGVEHSEIKPAAAGSGALVTFRDPDNIQLEVFFPGS